MKELRVQHKGNPVRVAFAFDPERSAIVPCAGDKTGINEKKFYKNLIREADAIFDRHLRSLDRLAHNPTDRKIMSWQLKTSRTSRSV